MSFYLTLRPSCQSTKERWFRFERRGRFHKAKMPKFVLQNAKIFKAFSMFNFIKTLTPENDGVFKVQFPNTNLALKMPKLATKR